MDYGKGNRKEEEMKRWEDSDSSCSSDSSEGHIILGKNIPRPTTTCMSAAQGGKKKKKKEPAAATICSAPCLSSSSQINQLIGMPGYDPNRIPASVFSGRPSNPMDWSLASNDSLFSIHMGNFSFSGDQALAALARSGEKQKSSSNPVPPSVRDPDTFEEMKPELTDKNMKQGEVSDDEGGGDEEIREEEGDEVIEPGSDDGSEISAETNRQEDEEGDDDEQQMQEQGGENEIVEEEDDDEVNEKKPTNPSDVTHSTSISCRSDTSNNSNCSFAFPVYVV
ncbi:PREDICTED: uncharacterized protein LOC104821167 [Tarenaya hassleriana]|uniref:uncharacterized protein LOC104821167 n=1 Tax=Tarenaya hassleriana TaxID=28532 RepID=UPI00053C3A64|nr:PREDICTED: uncharacterized protein LOC104821167 [Tarenaya hassleriana]